MRRTIFLAVPLLFSTLAHADWKVLDTFRIGGAAGWDYLTVDAQTHRLFVPRTTHTMVIDSTSGKTIADIPGQINAHGVAIASQARRGFISDGGGNGPVYWLISV
jgi:hypothetical protein